ncbi:hypothetical protein RLOC_00013054 [Lonchura striata]|uniref:Uncharacterized protein n=1 Tax=Lonchura striata TaxID=40157 RepID=A0A218V5R6_9PASE|nr:hypothetical protein RLOC_00013054 [Lonchura striata domestica]
MAAARGFLNLRKRFWASL